MNHLRPPAQTNNISDVPCNQTLTLNTTGSPNAAAGTIGTQLAVSPG